jgi:hypothetical protein
MISFRDDADHHPPPPPDAAACTARTPEIRFSLEIDRVLAEARAAEDGSGPGRSLVDGVVAGGPATARPPRPRG